MILQESVNSVEENDALAGKKPHELQWEMVEEVDRRWDG